MSYNKKILFLSNRGLLPIKDGHTRRSFSILKGLAANNQIHFLFLYENDEEISCEHIKKIGHFCCKVEFLPAPSKKIGVGMIARLVRSIFSKEPYTIWRHYSKAFLERVDELINSGEFDLVHCDILPISYAVRNRQKVFRSVTNHDVSYLKCLSMARYQASIILKAFMYLEAWKLKGLEKRTFEQVDLGIVVSSLDEGILKDLCPKGNFLVVENGVDLDQFYPSDEITERFKLIWVGGFNHYPNRQGFVFFLDEIYPLVQEEIPGVSIDVIGGSLTKNIKRFAENDPSVNLIGYVEDPLPYIHNATVFIVPILSGGGTRLKVLEAMAAGKAIVSTPIGCEGIEGTSGMHYLVAEDKRSFAANLITLLNDKELRRSLQRNARELVTQKYNYKYICTKLDNYYSQAVKSYEFTNKNYGI